MSSESFSFLRDLYPEGVAPNYLLVWTLDKIGDKEIKVSRWFTSIEAAAEFVVTCPAQNIYFGVALSPADFGPHARCKADQVAVLPGLYCDLDVAGAAHSKPGLPPTKEEARRIVPTEFPPTLIVDSGHGLYGFWLFKENWKLESQEERERAKALSCRWHQLLADNARRLEYTIDSVFDLNRVLRLVGTENRKLAGDHRLVQVVEDSGRRYEPSDLENILDLMGVPEVEVKKIDEDGRAEFGDLHVSPRAEMAPKLKQRLDALLVNDNDFCATWNRTRRMPRDNSWSGVAQSIANTLVLLGFSDQEIIDILSKHRREHGDRGKQQPKTLSWYTLYTIPKARTWASEQKERERKREEREAKKKESEGREAQEQRTVAEIQGGDEEYARAKLLELLDLPVHRLVQVGTDMEPSYKLVLKDERGERIVEIPSLAAVNSFVALDRFVWRYTGTPLPSKAKKKWRQVRTAFGKLIVVEDTGAGKIELMLTDLGEYFVSAHNTLFDKYPITEYPDGPPRNGGHWSGWHGCLVRAEREEEYRVALSLMALPQRDEFSIPGVYYLKCSDMDGAGADCNGGDGTQTARVVFRGPHFFDWLRKYKDRKFEIDEMNHRLVDAGFHFRDTAMECSVRLRRVWRGPLADATVDDHRFLLEDLGQKEWMAGMRKNRVQ